MSSFRKLISFGPSLIRFFSRVDIGFGPKLLVVAAFLYIVMPFDVVPDLLPIVGWIEDIVIGLLTFNYVNRKNASKPVVTKENKVDSIDVEARVIEDE